MDPTQWLLNPNPDQQVVGGVPNVVTLALGLAAVWLLGDMVWSSERFDAIAVHASPSHRKAMDRKWGYHYSVTGKKVRAR